MAVPATDPRIQGMRPAELALHCLRVLGPCAVADMRAYALAGGLFLTSKNLRETLYRLSKDGRVQHDEQARKWKLLQVP